MAQFTSLKAAAKKIEKTVQTSQRQVLKRALTSTRALYAKAISQEIGITSARAKSRSYTDTPTNKVNEASLVILTRTMFNAHEFSPGEKKVKSTAIKARTILKSGKLSKPKAGAARWTATFMVKGKGRELLPGSFLVNVSNRSTTKKLILHRASGAKYPTKTTVVNIFRPAVEKIVPQLQNHMVEEFNKNLQAQIKYNFSK